MMAHNYSTCSHCGACIKDDETCLCQIKDSKKIYFGDSDGNLIWNGEENILEIPSGWDANKLCGKQGSEYSPHVHVLIDEDMIKNLVTEGKVILQLPDGVNVELKYSGPKIIDFQIHKVNIESVENV